MTNFSTLVETEVKWNSPVLQPKGLLTEYIVGSTVADLKTNVNAHMANVANKYRAIVKSDFEYSGVEGAEWVYWYQYYDFSPVDKPTTRSDDNTLLSTPPMG